MTFTTHGADFNGDGLTDIAWRGADGSLALWSGAGFHAPAPAGFALRGFGDWNGDGTTDVVWQNAAGAVETWTMRDGQVSYTARLATLPPIQGIGDFDGNGRDDLIYQRADGVWNTISAEARKIPVASLGTIASFSPDYQLIGVGDFNGDGRADSLFHGSAGYLIQEPVTVVDRPDQLETAPRSFADPGQGWSMLGLADFEGDGRTDFLWQHTNAAGQVDNRTIWLSSGGGGQLIDPGPAWTVCAIDDYNNDGRADLLWHSLTEPGVYSEWLMNGATFQAHGATFSLGSDFWAPV